MSLNSLPLAEDASEDIHIEDDDSKSIVVDADAGLGPSKKKVTRNKRKISKEPRPSKKSKPNPEKGNSFVENLLHTTDVTRMWEFGSVCFFCEEFSQVLGRSIEISFSAQLLQVGLTAVAPAAGLGGTSFLIDLFCELLRGIRSKAVPARQWWGDLCKFVLSLPRWPFAHSEPELRAALEAGKRSALLRKVVVENETVDELDETVRMGSERDFFALPLTTKLRVLKLCCDEFLCRHEPARKAVLPNPSQPVCSREPLGTDGEGYIYWLFMREDDTRMVLYKESPSNAPFVKNKKTDKKSAELPCAWLCAASGEEELKALGEQLAKTTSSESTNMADVLLQQVLSDAEDICIFSPIQVLPRVVEMREREERKQKAARRGGINTDNILSFETRVRRVRRDVNYSYGSDEEDNEEASWTQTRRSRV